MRRAAGREPDDSDRTGKPGKPFQRRFGEPPGKAQENFTDPHSRIMKRGRSGFEQCCNVQIAVDEAERIVVAMGFDRFHLRGLVKTTGEWDLASLAANLRRMHGMMAWT